MVTNLESVFTIQGEAKPTSAFFLYFGDKNVKRISYAESFDCTCYPITVINKVKSHIERFQAISVRENTGITIMEEMGIEKVQLMPDPTLLLKVYDLNRLVAFLIVDQCIL